MSDGRTPAQIEADIARRRQDLAATLDEISLRVSPSTLVGEAKARTKGAVDRTAGQAFVVANRAVTSARGVLVAPDGAPRLERIVPVAVAAVAVAGLLAVGSRRPKKTRGRRRGR
ncbi:DUF3618 domain-containing protein [Streptomyces synnematoformans]|uniref:DUF3618 domain-containing protein n=1 Tax=Streptomyces synnematoformans TaxID=415721 RepID=A0ABN2ADH3_9ACTN